MSAGSLGAVAIAIHALAAAMWCGTLAALVLTVDHRGQWARVLPRFSELSLLCVIALLAGGLTGALVAVDSFTQLFATGYGRVLLIKIVLTVVLMTLGVAQPRPVAACGKVAPRHRLRVAVPVALRAGNHGGGVDHGRRTVGHRLGWND